MENIRIVLAILLMIVSVLCAVGWVGWGIAKDDNERKKRIIFLQSKIIDNLIERNIKHDMELLKNQNGGKRDAEETLC